MSVQKLVPIAEAGKLFPSRPHSATLRRWATQGVAGRKLETTLCGGKRFVSEDQARKFLVVDGRDAS